jgi:hypothetical protein
VSDGTIPSAQFVAGLGFYGVALDAYFNESNALYAQYVACGPGVALINEEQYDITPGLYNNEWAFSYSQSLMDFQEAMELTDNEALGSAANIMSVLVWQNLVDHFGDIPYSEALQGVNGILTPAYDDDEEIYEDLIARLDSAKTLLAATDDELGDEDILYGGDLDQWIKLANSLQLRLLIRQSGVVDVSADVVALIASGTFIETTADMPILPYDGVNNLNPSYARRTAGVGQFYCASFSTTNYLDLLNDPRDNEIYDDAADFPGSIIGLEQGDIWNHQEYSNADLSYPSSVCYGIANDVILMSNWEVYFLRAEADARYSTLDDETTMFNNAVQEHFTFIGSGSAATYLSTSVVYDALDPLADKLEMIGIQKWIASNGLQESEGWIESRRFDVDGDGRNDVFRDLTTGLFSVPTSSIQDDNYPMVHIYPQSELDYNSNAPAGRQITDRVFWDN